MRKHKMARWRRILRRNEVRRRQIRSIRRLRHSRSRAARICSAVILTIAWLVLPLLPGCGAGSTRSSESQSGASTAHEMPIAHPSSPDVPSSEQALEPSPSREIIFRGLDNEYRGSTHVLPNKQIVHQKEFHE